MKGDQEGQSCGTQGRIFELALNQLENGSKIVLAERITQGTGSHSCKGGICKIPLRFFVRNNTLVAIRL